MAGINPISAFVASNYNTQTGTSYPLTIDGNFIASARFAGNFLVHAQSVPNMTVIIDAGHIFLPSGPTLTETASSSTSTITAPSLLPRIDRVVADQTTGVISVVAGSENASPVAPAIPSGKMPLARIALQTSTTAITNAILTDERALWGPGTGGGFTAQASVASSATTDLGATGSNNIFITGNTTIGSFGSSATTSSPLYIVTFAGSLTLTQSAHLLLPGGASQITGANDALLANYLGAGNWQVLAFWSATVPSIPTGSLVPYAGSAAPSGYVLCNGQSLSTTTFANLFGVIGYTYGGSGASFSAPDLRGRVPVGFDTGNATGRMTASVFGGVNASILGNTGGQQTHTLTIPELPAHTHTQVNASSVTVASGGAYGTTIASPGISTTGATGSGTAHNVVQPSVVVTYICKI